jgi:hypothetical protein
MPLKMLEEKRSSRALAGGMILRKSIAVLATALTFQGTVAAAAEGCGFKLAFERPDEGGSETMKVYEGAPHPALGGKRPLAFISELKVNTDGTRVSYKVDDPHAEAGAINDIINALVPGRTVEEFEAVAKAGWPSRETWKVVSPNIIEKDARTGKPCVDPEGYLVSMTADFAVEDAWDRWGDCDQSKWLDALTIPAIVLPVGRTGFSARGAKIRSPAVVMTLDGPSRLAFGVVGDLGPPKELGEASVAMNAILNGLPPEDRPRTYQDAVDRFQGPRSVVLVFPGKANRPKDPITPETAGAFAQARFEAWGGAERLRACLPELGG